MTGLLKTLLFINPSVYLNFFVCIKQLQSHVVLTLLNYCLIFCINQYEKDKKNQRWSWFCKFQKSKMIVFFDIISYKSEMIVYFVNLIFLCIQVFTSQEYCFVYVFVSIININTLQIMIREGFSELDYTFFVPIK